MATTTVSDFFKMVEAIKRLLNILELSIWWLSEIFSLAFRQRKIQGEAFASATSSLLHLVGLKEKCHDLIAVAKTMAVSATHLESLSSLRFPSPTPSLPYRLNASLALEEWEEVKVGPQHGRREMPGHLFGLRRPRCLYSWRPVPSKHLADPGALKCKVLGAPATWDRLPLKCKRLANVYH